MRDARKETESATALAFQSSIGRTLSSPVLIEASEAQAFKQEPSDFTPLLNANGSGSATAGQAFKSSSLSLVVVAFIGFVGSVEYGLIFPTIWQYLNSLGMYHQYFLGVVISSFNVAQIISSPIFGYLSDLGISFKTLFVCSLFFGIVGNAIYFMASRAWMLLIARIVAGIGAGVYTHHTFY